MANCTPETDNCLVVISSVLIDSGTALKSKVVTLWLRRSLPGADWSISGALMWTLSKGFASNQRPYWFITIVVVWSHHFSAPCPTSAMYGRTCASQSPASREEFLPPGSASFGSTTCTLFKVWSTDSLSFLVLSSSSSFLDSFLSFSSDAFNLRFKLSISSSRARLVCSVSLGDLPRDPTPGRSPPIPPWCWWCPSRCAC